MLPPSPCPFVQFSLKQIASPASDSDPQGRPHLRPVVCDKPVCTQTLERDLHLLEQTPGWGGLCTSGEDVRTVLELHAAPLPTLSPPLREEEQSSSSSLSPAQESSRAGLDENGHQTSQSVPAVAGAAGAADYTAQELVYYMAQKMHEAVGVIESAIDQYGTDGITLSFNGGKDCMVVLHLLNAVLQRRSAPPSPLIHAVYVTFTDQFEQVESFVQTCAKVYNMDLWVVEGSIKQGLTKLSQTRPQIKAILAGTRRTDPFSEKLSHFSPTDGDWPPFIRVNPIIDWSYHDVWLFLRGMAIPYCSLYDEGFTSLGGKSNTTPNPALRISGGYAPAYQLDDGCKERDGRLKAPPKTLSNL